MATPTPKPKPPKLPPKPKPTADDGHRGSLTRHHVKDTTIEGKTVVPDKCDICQKFAIEANCTTCAKYICEHCVLIHKQMTELKDHRVVMLEPEATIPHSAEAISMGDILCIRCSPQGVVSECCVTCGNTGCRGCIISCTAAGHDTKHITKESLTLLKKLCLSNIQMLIDPTEKLNIFITKMREHGISIKPALDKEILRVRDVQKSLVNLINTEIDLYVNRCKENANALQTKVETSLGHITDNIKQNENAVKELTSASNSNDTALVLSILNGNHLRKNLALRCLDVSGCVLAEDTGSSIKPKSDTSRPKRKQRTFEVHIKQLCDILEPSIFSDDIDKNKSEDNYKFELEVSSSDILDEELETDLTKLEGRDKTIFASNLFNENLLFIRTIEKEIMVSDLQGNILRKNGITFSAEQFWINPKPFVLSNTMCGLLSETRVVLYNQMLDKISEFPNPKDFRIRTISSYTDRQFVSFETNSLLNSHQLYFWDLGDNGKIKRRPGFHSIQEHFPLDGEILVDSLQKQSIFCAYYNGSTIYQYSGKGILEKTFSLDHGITELSINPAGDIFIVRNYLCAIRKSRDADRYKLVNLTNDHLWVPDYGLPCALYSTSNALFYLNKECNYGCLNWLHIQKYTIR